MCVYFFCFVSSCAIFQFVELFDKRRRRRRRQLPEKCVAGVYSCVLFSWHLNKFKSVQCLIFSSTPLNGRMLNAFRSFPAAGCFFPPALIEFWHIFGVQNDKGKQYQIVIQLNLHDFNVYNIHFVAIGDVYSRDFTSTHLHCVCLVRINTGLIWAVFVFVLFALHNQALFLYRHGPYTVEPKASVCVSSYACICCCVWGFNAAVASLYLLWIVSSG